jgi:formylglycine-generating enzyme required for sulfatase activity
MPFFKAPMRGFLAVAVLASAVAAHADVFNMGGTRDPATGNWTGLASVEFVPVGDAGNAPDTATGSVYGSVPYAYQMGKYDVTVGQYCQFLNAVATTDTYGLYHVFMAGTYPTIGIAQSGSPGSYTYSVAGGYSGSYSKAANCPMFDLTWVNAARFCNWLQNGQPTGAQDLTTTEDGSYYLNGATGWSDVMAVTRKANATYVIPSENEWYKAAYYKGGSTNAGYWTYPTQSDDVPGYTLPDTGNHASFFAGYGIGYTDPANWLTPVGAFSKSPGPYGTFDMGGDIFQWNEEIIGGSSRGIRGGNWGYDSSDLAASSRYYDDPGDVINGLGFRVAVVPEPGSIMLILSGAIASLIVYWRRK